MNEKSWFIDKSIQQAQYMNMVNVAVVPSQVKDFCRYIASKATWNHTKHAARSYSGCFATHDTIEIEMNRSKDFVQKAKKKAVELGWIQVLQRPGTSDLIFPVVGEDDPAINKRVKRDRWLREDIKPVE
jgi:hypothetical protein